VRTPPPHRPSGFVAIDANTLETINTRQGGKATKVINLVKSIAKQAEEESEDPFLIALSDRARVLQEKFEDRQVSTGQALDELMEEIARNERRREEQAARGLDNLTYFVLCKLTEVGTPHAERVSRDIAAAFARHPHWRRSELALREQVAEWAGPHTGEAQWARSKRVGKSINHR